MKRNVLRITLALTLALTMVIASFSAVSAARNPAYIRLSGHPVAGDLEYFVGCRNADSAVGSYGVGYYDVTNSEYLTDVVWYNLPAETYSFQSPVILYTEITTPGKYAINLFFRSQADGYGQTLAFKTKMFKIR